ncbi:hypothetical protein ABFS83_03G045900 [Erythranthe nasuta]
MIIGWLYVALIAVSAGILALVFLLIIKKCFRRKNPRDSDPPERDRTLQSGIARLHQVSPAHNHHHHHRKDNNPAFSWADHPSYVTEAVENGWSRFAFVTAFTPPSPPPSAVATRSLLGSCGGGGGDRAAGVETNNNNNNNIEISWEVCEGSADFMQKIRLNAPNGGSTAGPAVSAVRAGLPLPGPNLGNASFPQEAYFEVTILSSSENAYDRDESGKLEGDRIKLIGEDFNAKNSSSSGDSLGHVKSSHSQRSTTKIEEAVSKIAKKQSVRNEGVSLCVGLVGGGGGGPFPVRFPGSFPGSIGFNSGGSVYLDGTKLVPESETNEWGGKTENVIGCGYNPSQKKVLFTVNSQLAHEINCSTHEFTSPMYPTIASSNARDITILINLGQSPFRFAPANLSRTRNPCFIGGPFSNSPALSYDEDSRELFSMGRIDSHWQQRSANRSNNNTVNSIRDIEYDQESEGDLFEIVLDSSGRSPYTTLHQ